MTLQSLKHEALKNKDVKQEYDRLESEFTLIEQLIAMRKEAGLTQEQLAQKCKHTRVILADWKKRIATLVGRLYSNMRMSVGSNFRLPFIKKKATSRANNCSLPR